MVDVKVIQAFQLLILYILIHVQLKCFIMNYVTSIALVVLGLKLSKIKIKETDEGSTQRLADRFVSFYYISNRSMFQPIGHRTTLELIQNKELHCHIFNWFPLELLSISLHRNVFLLFAQNTHTNSTKFSIETQDHQPRRNAGPFKI